MAAIVPAVLEQVEQVQELISMLWLVAQRNQTLCLQWLMMTLALRVAVWDNLTARKVFLMEKASAQMNVLTKLQSER